MRIGIISDTHDDIENVTKSDRFIWERRGKTNNSCWGFCIPWSNRRI